MPWYMMHSGLKIEDFIYGQPRICEADVSRPCIKVQLVNPVHAKEYPILQTTLKGENKCVFYVKSPEPAGWHKPLHRAD